MDSSQAPRTTGEETHKPDEAAPTLEVHEGGHTTQNLEMILDIPLRVSVELGRTKILVEDLLKLQKGSVVELNKLAGEPLEVLVNDKIVARGEVVVVSEKFGVRLVEVVNHQQRIRHLGVE